MSDVFNAVREFEAARDAEDVSVLRDEDLVLACAYYGSIPPNVRFSTSMRNAAEANHALAIAEVERRGLVSKLKHAAAVVSSARLAINFHMEGIAFFVAAVKLLATIAIICVAYADISGVIYWLASHRRG